MSNLRTIRSFTVEMLKIAADINDADIRKLLADRRGQDYLVGGRLISNSEAEAPYFPKMSSPYSRSATMVASGNYNLGSHKKKDNTYQKVRDYAATGIKGGLTGLGILGASNAMRGNFKAPAAGLETIKAMRSARRAATVGASATVLDRAYRYNEQEKKASFIHANPNAAFRSPAEELATSSRTGRFEAKVHNYGKAPHTVQLGNKFRLP